MTEPDRLLAEADNAFRRGRFSEAIKRYQSYFDAVDPNLFGLLRAARAAVKVGDEKLALDWYGDAMALAPSHGTAFSRKASLLLEKHFDTRPSVTPDKRPQISMRALGNKGRFGNQVFQYAFLRRYADQFNLQVATPEWPGQHIFGVHDPFPTTPPEPLRQSQVDMPAALKADIPALAGRDITGYFQFHTAGWSNYRTRFQSLFTPVATLSNLLRSALADTLDADLPLVVLHVRRGDFAATGHQSAPVDWYREWLASYPTGGPFSLYIASDDSTVRDEFADYGARALPDLHLDHRFDDLGFVIDWMMLRCASVVGLSNSTFSVSAALANPGLTLCMRPDFGARKLIQIDPWNGPVLYPAPGEDLAA